MIRPTDLSNLNNDTQSVCTTGRILYYMILKEFSLEVVELRAVPCQSTRIILKLLLGLQWKGIFVNRGSQNYFFILGK